MHIKLSELAKYLNVRFFGRDILIRYITCDASVVNDGCLFIVLSSESYKGIKCVYWCKSKFIAYIVDVYFHGLSNKSYIIVDNIIKTISKVIMFLKVKYKFFLFIIMSNLIYKTDFVFHNISINLSNFYKSINICIYDKFDLFKIIIKNYNKYIYFIINIKIINFNNLFYLFKYICPDFVIIDSMYNSELLSLNSNLSLYDFKYKFLYLSFVKTLLLRLDSVYSICFLNSLIHQDIVSYSLYGRSDVYCSFFLDKEYSIVLGVIINTIEIRVEIYSNIRFSLCYILEFILILVSLNINIKNIVHFLIF